jgi:hypothetical protein
MEGSHNLEEDQWLPFYMGKSGKDEAIWINLNWEAI